MTEPLEVLEEWEEYDPEIGIRFFTHIVAGFLPGAAESYVMFPADAAKT